MSCFAVLVPRTPLVRAAVPEADGGVWAPPVDVSETGADLVIGVEVSSTPPGDIRVTGHPHTLLIEGVKGDSVPRQSLSAGERFLRVTRTAGPFGVLVRLPAPVDRDRGRARFRDGVPTVSLPKIQP